MAEAKLQVLLLLCLSFLFFLQSSCFWNVRRLPVLSIFLLEGDSGWICFLLQPGLCWPLIRVWADGGRGGDPVLTQLTDSGAEGMLSTEALGLNRSPSLGEETQNHSLERWLLVTAQEVQSLYEKQCVRVCVCAVKHVFGASGQFLRLVLNWSPVSFSLQFHNLLNSNELRTPWIGAACFHFNTRNTIKIHMKHNRLTLDRYGKTASSAAA